MKTILFSLFLFSTFLLSSCSKPSPTPAPTPTTYDNTFTVNGGTFTNTVLNLNANYVIGDYGLNGSTQTEIFVKGTTPDGKDSAFIDFVFGGSKAGTYAFNTTSNFGSIFVTPLPGGSTIQMDAKTGSGNMVITSFGGVGGNITGTFSGTFSSGTTDYVVSNGSFSVKRAQ